MHVKIHKKLFFLLLTTILIGLNLLPVFAEESNADKHLQAGVVVNKKNLDELEQYMNRTMQPNAVLPSSVDNTASFPVPGV